MRLSAITCVVLNWETADATVASVGLLVGDGLPAERIVVVDNGSKDDSYERLQQELPGCVVIRLEENVGYARAANTGAGALTGDAYMFVDNDAFLHAPGSVATLLRELDDETIGVVAPRILNEDLTLQPSVVPLKTPTVALVQASGLSRLIPNRSQPEWSTHWDHTEERTIQAMAGPVFLVRGRTWRDLGGYDERLAMYADELDLCWRASKVGWQIRFSPTASWVHIGFHSGRRHWTTPQRQEMIGRSEAQMIRRHLSPLQARLTLQLMSAGLAARWLYRRSRRQGEAAAALAGSLRGLNGHFVPDARP